MSERTALEYFSGGVPTGEYFGMTLENLREISASEKEDTEERGVSRLQELCFVGLFSYFEAFCKDQFAALINIEPSLVENLKAAGQDVQIDARHVVAYGEDANCRLGFVLAAKSDFGTAQKINSQYRALLKVSPFSKDEEHQFERLLADRHLLVHHGGVVTLAYVEQHPAVAAAGRSEPFFDSRALRGEDVTRAIDFVESIARKLCRSTCATLVKYVESRGEQYTGERARALYFLEHWWRDAPS